MALATTCPRCATSFKVVPDQLKLRRGLVRCGMCQHVFSGIDYLRYVDESVRPGDPGGPSAGAAAPIAPPPGARDPAPPRSDEPAAARPDTPVTDAPDLPPGPATVQRGTADTHPPPADVPMPRGTSTDEAIATGTWLAEPGAAPLEWRPSGPPSIVTSPAAAAPPRAGAPRPAEASDPWDTRDDRRDGDAGFGADDAGALVAAPEDALLWHTAATAPQPASDGPEIGRAHV